MKLSVYQIKLNLNVILSKEQFDKYTLFAEKIQYPTLTSYIRNVIKDSLDNLEWIVNKIDQIKQPESRKLKEWYNFKEREQYNKYVIKGTKKIT